VPEDQRQGLGLGRVQRAERQETRQFRRDRSLNRRRPGPRPGHRLVILPEDVKRVPRGGGSAARHFGQRPPVGKAQPADAAAGHQPAVGLSARGRHDGFILQQVPDPPYLRAQARELVRQYRELVAGGQEHAQIGAGRGLGRPLVRIGDLQPGQRDRLVRAAGRHDAGQGIRAAGLRSAAGSPAHLAHGCPRRGAGWAIHGAAAVTRAFPDQGSRADVR